LAESALNHRGGRFRAFSAGSYPKGAVVPDALHVLERLGYSTKGLRSKSWDEFSVPGSPVMDCVFTVCDNAAGEVCPIWPGHPMTAHWGIEDPSSVEETVVERERAFVEPMRFLENRIFLFAMLPLEALEAVTLQAKLREIGHAAGSTAKRGDAA
jgi:arsenate reductase